MSAIKLQVENREEIGKNRADKLRRNGIVPGVLYSKGKSTAVKVNSKDFDKVYRLAGTSTIIDLEIEGETVPSLIKEVQMHPYRNQYMHVDFQKVDMNEPVRVMVPIVLIGKDNIKTQPSVLMQQLDSIEIECLPKYIPEVVEVDVSNIDFNTPIHVSDLSIFNDENIKVLMEPDDLVATLVTAAEEEESVEEEPMAPDEVPIVGKDEEE
ncbi:MAG TPA: 50S ribosomal protein L25 [Tissierellia bacterium]|nr:50S ribosomal protein L25 [Tissierellia bacterium]